MSPSFDSNSPSDSNGRNESDAGARSASDGLIPGDVPPPGPSHAPDLSIQDEADLRRAKAQLEQPGLGIKLASMLGTPMDRLLRYLPGVANDALMSATRAALQQCLNLAVRTFRHRGAEDHELIAVRKAPAKRMHRMAAIASGAAGGAFGLFALPIELPFTTTLMFRSICEIARSEGEQLDDPDTRLQCMLVFAMGGPVRADDDAAYGYFLVRGALAQSVSKASAELAAKGIGQAGSGVLGRFLHAVAARFSAQVGEQLAAKSVPVLGAVLGAAVNGAFIDHFQQIAHGHFTVRRLERRYGEAKIRAHYEAL